MKYINKKLSIEKVAVENIAKRFKTPTYCYSYKQLKGNIRNFKKSFKSFSPLICFSVKSLSTSYWSMVDPFIWLPEALPMTKFEAELVRLSSIFSR